MSDENDFPDEIVAALQQQLQVMPSDPAEKAPYPVGLSLDLALETAPLKEILDSYNLSPMQAQRIFANPAFRSEYEAHRESMTEEGWSFRKKAAAQAEAYLGLMWRMANDTNVLASVRADIIKHTVKYAGLDAPASAQNKNDILTPQMLQQLQQLPDSELEIRVMQIVQRKNPAKPADTTQLIEGETLDT
jgi:hypothetical protein